MNYNLVLTEEAEDDFAEILAYTEQKWGIEQRRRYAAQIDSALAMLEDDPRIGTKNRQLPPIYRVYHVGRHYIVFRIEGAEVIVLRILHDQMDLKRHIK